ncbi:MAG: DNA polymerase IV [Candidatus Omnitrophota bacterium]
MKTRLIFHIDMDAFFASVEQRDAPSLRNKPIAVIGANARTVVVTSSYNAREFGVRTGMNTFEARRMCPQIVFVEACNKKYTRICGEIFDILYTFSPDIEVYSIDEFFIDMTGSLHLFGTVFDAAAKMKHNIKGKTGLTASVGIGSNKLLAKLASDKNKPDGLFWIKQDEAKDILRDLEVDALWGIGPKTREKLNALNIYTLGQLAKYSVSHLKKIFGVYGEQLHLMSLGIDNSAVIPLGQEAQAKSIGHSRTLAYDTTDLSVLKKHLLDLSELVGRRMRQTDLQARTITLTVRYTDFNMFTRQKILETPTEDTRTIYHVACKILEKIKLTQKVRLLGVSAGKLSPADRVFLFEEDKKRFNLNRTIDKINKKAKTKLTYASLLEQSVYDCAVSPSCRPKGIKRY